MSSPSLSLLETIQLEHLPPGHDVHIALFSSLQNADFLQRQLLEGNKDFEYALIDASVIVSKIHILSAVYRAVNDLLEQRLRSRNVHSEIVFSLGLNNNIATSFRTFGITPTTTSLLLVKVTTPETPEHTPSSIQSHITSAIEGQQIPFTDENLVAATDWAKVRKLYKLNTLGSAAAAGGGGGGKKVVNGVVGRTDEEERRELEVIILGSMALRGATS